MGSEGGGGKRMMMESSKVEWKEEGEEREIVDVSVTLFSLS